MGSCIHIYQPRVFGLCSETIQRGVAGSGGLRKDSDHVTGYEGMTKLRDGQISTMGNQRVGLVAGKAE